jgi:hypothetical protein
LAPSSISIDKIKALVVELQPLAPQIDLAINQNSMSQGNAQHLRYGSARHDLSQGFPIHLYSWHQGLRIRYRA